MKTFNLNFTSKFPLAAVASIILVTASLFLFFSKGLNYGVDFRGGAEVQVQFEQKVTLDTIRNFLQTNNFSGSQVQAIGEPEDNEFLVKIAAKDEDLNKKTDELAKLFEATFASEKAAIRKTDIVGPKAGAQLRNSGFQAMAWALLLIMIYIGLRFDFKYSPGAIIALTHDVLIIIGIYVLTGREFSLQIVGALLAIIGYSVNDTVVVYDRVREHEQKDPTGNLSVQINTALNETLRRTILTSITTFAVAFTMYSFGGGVIHDFFFTICIGVLVGTYSSVFVAAPIVLFFDRFKTA